MNDKHSKIRIFLTIPSRVVIQIHDKHDRRLPNKNKNRMKCKYSAEYSFQLDKVMRKVINIFKPETGMRFNVLEYSRM